MQKKKENRGGYRPGSGQKKKQTLCLHQVEEGLEIARKYAKAEGKKLQEVLLDFCYGKIPDATPRDRLAAIKIFLDKHMAQIKEGSETDQALGPSVYLPDEKPDPAKVVQLKAV